MAEVIPYVTILLQLVIIYSIWTLDQELMKVKLVYGHAIQQIAGVVSGKNPSNHS